jgi:hypothetical protein
LGCAHESFPKAKQDLDALHRFSDPISIQGQKWPSDLHHSRPDVSRLAPPPFYKAELDPGEPWVFPIEFRDRFWRNTPNGNTYVSGQIQAVFSIKDSASRQPDFWSGTVESLYVACTLTVDSPKEKKDNPLGATRRKITSRWTPTWLADTRFARRSLRLE